jgi:hypothetical protein
MLKPLHAERFLIDRMIHSVGKRSCDAVAAARGFGRRPDF